MIYYIIACFGLTCILKYGSILNPIRNILCKLNWFNELFKCSLCLGFWSGMILGILGWYTSRDLIFIILPFISSGVCWFGDSTLRVIQTIELFLDKKLEK